MFRASGLSRIAGTGSKARLAVDAAALECWRQLNATEQYFTLLEAWLRVGQPEMVGEKGGRWREGFLGDCLQTWRFIPARGEKLEREPGQAVYLLGISRHLYHLALMDLFGLMQVEHPRSAVQPWTPARVRHVPFGDAVFTLLGQRMFSWMTEAVAEDENEEDENFEDDEDERTGAPDFGRWQAIFQPYFPEWQNNLVLPGTAAREGIFIFRVSLGEIWRRIAMPADASLDDLVSWILHSVRFDSDHLYEFRYRDRYGATIHAQHPSSHEGPWADDVLLGELPLEPGQSLELTYDFGDDWKFTVQLEQIEPTDARRKAPKILERHGKAPPQYPNWD